MGIVGLTFAASSINTWELDSPPCQASDFKRMNIGIDMKV